MNPFKHVEEFEDEVNGFLRRHKAFLVDQGNRISDYFEMSCYNKVVRRYEAVGFSIKIQNLIGQSFRYKLSPSGYPENFSHFELVKAEDSESPEVVFEVHHNLTVQSGHQKDIYLTPDISIINGRSIISDYDHYTVVRSKKKFCYVKNSDLQTFFEVKNFNPFPELLYSFVGLYTELKMKAIDDKLHLHKPFQIAPGLMVSGKENEHTKRIKKSLENRYNINILFDLFEKNISSKSDNLKMISSIQPKAVLEVESETQSLEETYKDVLPF